ncbi:hypothetical protein BC936DRAFT_143440 [Jimgerdemannia flammicorona]|uniref:Uncharacterized protein n=2 Tax=Jimgerdemannia flammicorona TaxID=994334 RepID=A0A433PB43_9FUNG|nr:hypothetical protein BC936DRAFT_143440 [Jimgerdemannia flammicorona]RUS14751.1 hypothetical protein BC938DRAFT_477240 [Jimgerdemannia flammicorona]
MCELESRVRALTNWRILPKTRDVNRVVVPPKRRSEVNYLTATVDPARTGPNTPITVPELLLSIAIYQENRPHSRLQEFLILGSQPMTALRDAVYCLSDFLTYEANDEASMVNKHHRKVSSSYFFLEGTFYVDKRAEKENNLPVEDYSK